MNSNPKLGVFLMTAEWFREVGMQCSTSSLTAKVDLIADSIIKKISEFSNPIYNGVIYSENSAREAAVKARESDIEVMLISPLMWSEDKLLKTILKELSDIPILFCAFMPYKSFNTFITFEEMLKGSGIVGSLQMSGYLKREELNYEPFIGFFKDVDLYKEIKKHIIAISINKRLQNLTVGVLPFRCDQMTTTYVDEFNLNKLYGIELKYLELQKIKEVAQSFSEKEIENLKSLIYKLGFNIQVDNKNLNEAAKYSLALEKISKDYNLKALAINDVIEEMHQCFGLRPCLFNPGLSEFGVSISMEADIAAVIAMHILNEFTGQKPFYSEILCADLKNNCMLMGHAGYHEYENNDPLYPVSVISDPEYKSSDTFTGACLYYKYKPGPITIINSVFSGEKIRWTTIEGESLAGPPILEGDPHIHCSIKKPLKDFFEENIRNGVSQHWIVVYGHIVDDLKIICRWNNIEFIRL